MDPAPKEEFVEPANLRFLRRLVTVLTATMIFGLVAIFTVLVIRLQTPTQVFPDTIALPEGAAIQSLTTADGYLLVVTHDNRVLIYSPDGQTIRQEIALNHP